MKLILSGNDFRYDMQNMCYLFFPDEKVVFDDIEENTKSAVCSVTRGKKRITVTTVLKIDGVEVKKSLHLCVDGTDEKAICLLLARSFYMAASQLTEIYPPWGILTGIRPVKRVRDTVEKYGRDTAVELIQRECMTNKEKIDLCLDIIRVQKPILGKNEINTVSLYISIPFCPSRCGYCSFVSRTIEKEGHLLDEYISCLMSEISEQAKMIVDNGYVIKTVYIGGGTPIILDSVRLNCLLSHINDSFDLSNIEEYTIEAGRPELVTEDKLRVIRANAVNRVCINPQTMRNEILHGIGRRHTSDDVVNACKTARFVGIERLNMDLIAGLPNDTVEGFTDSILKVLEFRPENITIHTLVIKRAANITIDGTAEYAANSKKTQEMLKISYELLLKNGYVPYYLYRQKKTLANLENVGYCLPGYEGLYNIFMMEELHSIIAMGAGGITKLVVRETGSITRKSNCKYPAEYIKMRKKLE